MIALFWVSCGLLSIGIFYKWVDPEKNLFCLKDIITLLPVLITGPICLAILFMTVVAVVIADFGEKYGSKIVISIPPRKSK